MKIPRARTGYDDRGPARQHLADVEPLLRRVPVDGAEPAEFRLALLGGFDLVHAPDRTPCPLPPNVQRLIALSAVAGRRRRCWLAGTLWPDAPDEAAQGRLRTVTWRLQREVPGLLTCFNHTLGLRGDISVDVHDFRRAARAVLDGERIDQREIGLIRDLPELLPGWYGDWVEWEQRDLLALRLLALERLGSALLADNQPAAALPLALAAVSAEPLRDSAHQLVIQAHLAQGNAPEAMRLYDSYRRRLDTELGIPPSNQLQSLMNEMYAGFR